MLDYQHFSQHSTGYDQLSIRNCRHMVCHCLDISNKILKIYYQNL